MTTDVKPKSLGAAIDAIIAALSGMDQKDQQVAINAVCTHLGLKEENTGSNLDATQYNADFTPGTAYGGSGGPATRPIDIRSLKDEKQPNSAREMACIVAFYLETLAPPSERKTSINAEDIDKYFKQANYPVPAAKAQLLMDAKLAGYFDSADRGSYKLNPVGYNLVAHSLPKSASSTKPRARQSPSKKTAKKSAKKKGK